MKLLSYVLIAFFLSLCTINVYAQVTPLQSEIEPESLEVIDVVDEQPLITNVFYETEVREALAAISAQSAINIIPDQTVYGFITLELTDVPFEEALRRILTPLGYTFKRKIGYYLVGSAYPDNPSFPLLSVTEKIIPNYLKAVNVPRLLSSFYDPFIRVDVDANILTVTASPEIIQRIKEDLAVIDVPPRQVMIEALVTELSTEARKSLGLDASWLATKDEKQLDVIFPVGDLLDSTLGLSILRPDEKIEGWVGDFKIAFKALVQDGEVNIRANPRVVTLEGQKALIVVGKEQYYVIYTGTTGYYTYGNLEKIPVGVSLTIVPYISEKNEITVEIQPEVSDVVGTGATGLPVVSKRVVVTKVRVKDGETIVIGGLLQKNESLTRRKVPLLGDIPILGYLFSRSEKTVDEVETVVFITPHILKETASAEGS